MQHGAVKSAAALGLAIAAALFTACSGERTVAPPATGPLASARGAPPAGPPGPAACQSTSIWHIVAIYKAPDLDSATAQFTKIGQDLSDGHHDEAVNDMFTLWNHTLEFYYADKLNGGMSLNTQTATLKLGNSLYCLVGLDGSALTLTTTPLDPNSVVKVVFPSTSDQTVVTGSVQAGVKIPGGTLSQPVTIAVTAVPGNFTFPAGPLNTKLDQYGPFFEFKVIPAQTFTTPVLAAACIATPAGDAPPSTVDIAHNVGTGIEILPTEPAPFLLCGATGLAPQPHAIDLLRDGEYGRALKQLASRALTLFTPATGFASTAGIGGRTKSFSPFGGVDTAVVVKFATGFPAQPQTAAAGSNVPATPSALIETANGHTPLGGASVTMTVMSGGGSIGPTTSSTRVTTTTLTSNATTGIASVPNWTLGAGPANSLAANASFSLPANISGYPTVGVGPGSAIVVSGNPLTYTATSTDVIPYGASGYVYASGAVSGQPGGPFQGFQQPTYAATPANGWQTGTAPFGSTNLHASCAQLPLEPATVWPNLPNQSSDMLLRKSFTLPQWWTGDLTFGIAIDNDFKLYIDGTNLTPTTIPQYNPSTGFVQHENCVTADSFVFPVHVGPGTHIMAVRARDRGVAAYVDTRLGVSP